MVELKMSIAAANDKQIFDCGYFFEADIFDEKQVNILHLLWLIGFYHTIF